MTIAQHKIQQYMTDNNISQRRLSLTLGYCHNYINIILKADSIPEVKEIETIEQFFGIVNEMHNLKAVVIKRHGTIRRGHEYFKNIHYVCYSTYWRLCNGYTTSRKDLLKQLSLCYNLKNEWIEEYKES